MNTHYRQARHRIKERVKKIMLQRDSEGKRSDGRLDFLDMLMAQDNISEEETCSLVLDMLLGGYETTSLLIAIIVKFLSEKSNSEILSKLRVRFCRLC